MHSRSVKGWARLSLPDDGGRRARRDGAAARDLRTATVAPGGADRYDVRLCVSLDGEHPHDLRARRLRSLRHGVLRGALHGRRDPPARRDVRPPGEGTGRARLRTARCHPRVRDTPPASARFRPAGRDDRAVVGADVHLRNVRRAAGSGAPRRRLRGHRPPAPHDDETDPGRDPARSPGRSAITLGSRSIPTSPTTTRCIDVICW